MAIVAAAGAEVDPGDTAWMLIATALVLVMTPALGLFYAGLVRGKNTLNTFMMCVAALAVATVMWALVGYSIAFDEGNGFIGGLGHAFLRGVAFAPREDTTIPHLLFMAFQATFCIVTVALVSGAVVERMRFGPFLVFAGLWSVLVYAGALGLRRRLAPGARDSRLRRRWPSRWGPASRRWRPRWSSGRGRTTDARRSCPTTRSMCVGAGLLWFGWFGFNGGSGFSTGNSSVLAFTNTLLCPAATLSVWFGLDLLRGRQVTAIGAATAIIVGCVLITPAGGFISPGSAMLLGALGALPSYAIIVLRPRTRVDETLDVLAAHGAAGLTGILFIGFFAQEVWNGVADGLLYGNAAQLGWQALAAVATPVYAFVVTFVLLRVIGLVMPLRATEREEALGMDIVQHGEEAYATGEGAILVTPEDGVKVPPPVADPA